MATDHRGNEVHAGKRTSQERWAAEVALLRSSMPAPKNQMSTMPSPGVAVEYPKSTDSDTYVLTGNEVFTGDAYNDAINNPKTGQRYPEPVAWDFDNDSPELKPKKSKGVPKPKRETTEEERASRDTFW